MSAAVPTAEETSEFERRLEVIGGHFTCDQYVAIVGELAKCRSPNREIEDFGGEPFEV